MRLVYLKHFSTFIILLCAINLFGQEDMFERIKRLNEENYVQQLKGDYFRILNTRVNAKYQDEVSRQVARRRFPPNSVDSFPNELCYIYKHKPINSSLHLTHLDGLYTVEYDGKIVYINYFKKDIFYHYVFKKFTAVWELQDIQSYRMKENQPGIISLYEHLTPKQITAKVNIMILYGYTVRNARNEVQKQLYKSAPLKRIGLVHIDKANHILLTSNVISDPAESSNSYSQQIQYWEVGYGTPKALISTEHNWE